MALKKPVYFFGDGKAEGKGGMKNLLGGKGAGLAEMSRLGIPVPAGFTITTEVCTSFYENKKRYPKGLEKAVADNLKKVEKVMGAKFGDPENPLLLSVRSGARVSMPGMMDTVLNLGLNDTTIKGLIKQTNNPRFAYDAYRRFVQMYGDVVLGLKPEGVDDIDPFEEILESIKNEKGVKFDNELEVDALSELVTRFKNVILKRTGKTFPENPADQLWGAIGAVFGSWDNPRADAYRRLNDIPAGWGTAVNVQSMVYGNMGDDSGTGVLFSRDPATGDNQMYGEFLMNAQGEDVVAGIRTPRPISELKGVMPEVHKQLEEISKKLETHFGDMQDMEFTIQKGKLWMLQTRAGKRTGFAAVRVAVDFVSEGLIDKNEAIKRIPPDGLNQLLRPVFDSRDKREALGRGRLLAKGLNAGPGAASGRIVFNAEDAEAWAARGEEVILTRIETSPEDIRGMDAAVGILTARGGMTSHAALVARQMGKVCVAGCGELNIDYPSRSMRVGGTTVNEGEWVSIDGTTGEVIEGKIRTIPSEVVQVLVDKTMEEKSSQIFQVYNKLMEWADQTRKLKIRTNADQPDQANQAIHFGAEGIGLCRTEHMFFGEEKIGPMREMILSEDKPSRERALSKLLPLQKKDFKGLFMEMEDRPVTIRTLDPPLHEFLPHNENDIQELAVSMGVSVDRLKYKIESLREFNPMLGHRGCRLGVSYPEITAMQARAILEAAVEVKQEKGKTPVPEIMIPFVGHVKELENQVNVVREAAEKVFKDKGAKISYLVGTMIELPRAALCAKEIANHAEFFSFGTNDLTQTTMGLSRDDSQSFLPYYVEADILDNDPFQTIDKEGVGQLLSMGTERGRQTRKNLKVGICGEHGGDPKSIHFCQGVGLNYVSCSPYRVPIARLAAAQAALEADGAAKKKPAKKKVAKKKVAKKKVAKKKVAKKKVAKKKVAKKKVAKKKVAKKKVAKKKVAKKKVAKMILRFKLSSLLILLFVFSCTEEHVGDTPPDRSLQFPVGIAIHPLGYALVVNSNFNVAYNSGSLRVVDLRALQTRIADDSIDKSDEYDYHRDLILDDLSIGLGNFAASIRLVSSGKNGLAAIASRGTKELLLIDLHIDDDDNLKLSCWQDRSRPSGQKFPECQGSAHIVDLQLNDPFDVLISDNQDYDVESDLTVWVGFLRSDVVAAVHVPKRFSSDDPSLLNLDELPEVAYSLETGNNGSNDMAQSPETGLVYVTSRYSGGKSNPIFYFDSVLGEYADVNSHDLYPDLLGNETRGIVFAEDGLTAGILMRDPDILAFVDTTPDYTGLPAHTPLGQVVVGANPSRVKGHENLMYATCAEDDAIYVVDALQMRLIDKREDVCRGPFDIGFYDTDQVTWALVTCFEDDSVAILDVDPSSQRFLEVIARVGEPRNED
jgi:pyruvate,orthophosphate dikinase